MEATMKQTKYMKVLILALILVGISTMAYAQTTGTATADVTINEVALLAVNTATMPAFVVDAPTNAGELPVITPSGDPTYLQYTVVVDPLVSATKRITASCDLAMLAGLKMDVWAAAPTGTGGVGAAAAGGLEIDSAYTGGTAVDLITGITSCATGSGSTQGPAVYYTLSIDASTFDAMETATATTFTITYSLVD